MVVKRQWTAEEYAAWFASLVVRRTPAATRRGRFEVKHAGGVNYLLLGGGRQFWADGIEAQTVLEAKLIVKPEQSPFIFGSRCPDFVRESAEGQVRDEFERIKEILLDDRNPLTSVRIITNEERAIPFFTGLLEEYNLRGAVVVRPE
jgi:hypothetical protein